MSRIMILIDEEDWNCIANDIISDDDVDVLRSVRHTNREDLQKKISIIIEQDGEGLLDDDGVDESVAHQLAKGIVGLVYRDEPRS